MAVTEPQKKPFFLHLARQPTFNVETWPFASVVSRTLWSWIRVCAVDPANEPPGGGGTAEASAAASAATTAGAPQPHHPGPEPRGLGFPPPYFLEAPNSGQAPAPGGEAARAPQRGDPLRRRRP